MKIVSEAWNDTHDKLQLQVAGVGGARYVVPVFNAPSGIAVEGAVITKGESGLALEVSFAGSAPDAYTNSTVTLHFPAE